VARTAAGAFGSRQTLSTPGHDAQSPELAVNRSGAAAVTWERFDGTNFRVQARARAVGGNLSGVQNLSPAGIDAASQEVGIDDAGDAVFIWTQADGPNFRAAERGRSASGALDPIHLLSTAAVTAAIPHIAVAPTGDAVFTWERDDPAGVSIVQARERDPGGQLFAVQTVADSDHGEGAEDPVLAIDGDGDALIAWQEVAARIQIQAAAGP
jgi:hypothetical protein